jgi:hypothetical protein
MAGPDVWGPHGWKFIHYITLGYPNNPTEQDKKKYYDFFTTLKYVIPCPICSTHFIENLTENPLSQEVLKNKINLIQWGIDMHNLVNIKNKKKIYTYEEGIKDILTNNSDKCATIPTTQSFTNAPSKSNNIYLILSVC